MQFVLVNQSSTVIDPIDLANMAAILTVQLNRDYALYWGGRYCVEARDASGPFAPGEVVCHIDDDLPNAPGAVAYHDIQGGELPVIFVAMNLCSGILDGSGCLLAALSHECLEAAGDPSCNRWADNGMGDLFALEMCDATQEDSYEIVAGTGKGAVSNFVLPDFFSSGSPGPYSFMASRGSPAGPIAPFDTAPGGYQIKRTAGGETQVTGKPSKKFGHFSSRGMKRGAKP